MTVRITSNRRGATLPLAILAIVLISLVVAAGYARVSSERRINGDQQAQVDAFAVAQSGLERYINGIVAMPPASHDTTITGIPGGSAQVSLRRLHVGTGSKPTLYVITSRGTSTGSVRYGASTPSAERTVAQYGVWQPGNMSVSAAWTSITGLNKSGGSGTLSGVDQCGVMPAVAGVAVPNAPGYNQTGGASVPTGGPPPIGSLGADTAAAKSAVHVDWPGILNDNAIPPDFVIPTQSWPTSTQMNSWPTIRVNGDADIPSGKGVLIITGNATINGSINWQGVVLVGGTLTSTGNNTVQGAVVSGLNVQLGMSVGASDVGSGTKTYVYNSCSIDSALTNLGKLQRIRNGWTDNWPSY
jgi:Tfp pilus assembly protein PilX